MEELFLNFLKVTSTVISGGVVWETVKFFFPDLKKYFNSRIEANKILNSNIDPILKSADELFGKLTSLAKDDFKIFQDVRNSQSDVSKIYIYYLFAQFWARLELLRVQSDYISLSRTKKGSNLLKLITAYEARKNRILDRSLQRMIGEALIEKSNKDFRVISLYEFTTKIKNGDQNLLNAIKPLDTSLHKTVEKPHRQKVLIFGIIVCCLIDYFDNKHKITREREIYKNKLTLISKDQIKGRVMEHYLSFIKKKEKYYK